MDYQELLKDTKIVNGFKSTKKIISVRHDNSINDILELFSYYHIYSAPVLTGEGKIYTIIDMMDIVSFIINISNLNSEETVNILDQDPSSFSKFLENNSEIFSNTRCFQILENKPNKIIVVNENESCIKLLDVFSETISKVLIVNDQFEVVNIISQSDLLSLMAQNIYCLGSLRDKIIDRVGVSTTIKASFLPTTRVITILLDLLKKGLTCAPILDSNNRLMANFSITNIKGIRRHNFNELILPVMDYLNLQKIKEKKHNISSLNESSFHPLVCNGNCSLEYVIYKIVATKFCH
ncbi:hypothetical protein DLAC_01497 [Tieghemostelium lacteum]|uniref:CBS domain-containing protein n=1 Tax=Tieghemostelium lacteum TaxID=361077 RepID=A0A152A5L0_TIELA|nr:hypothetical protein DLAC_01497 [Tieghemostelium lacteum]|eukprot:KYR01508.1 hypothetical protein DLAC_01497 [Tieghemostelium lacteum]